MDASRGAVNTYGAIVIDAADPTKEVMADHEYVIQLQEWLKREGSAYPAMFMESGLANYFTINGKAYPSTDTIRMKVGETLKVRFNAESIFMRSRRPQKWPGPF